MELYATELMGSKAYDSEGNFVGRVREFFIEPAEAPNRVSHYLLSRGNYQPLVAKHNQVASVCAGKLKLNVGERALELYRPNESWLAVQKDLMDQQIIDTRGRKVVRVNDVDLQELKANGNVELRLTQVDVGLPGAVRRLLQGVVPPAMIRRLQSQLPQKAIRWEFVNLIEPDPLRRVKLRISHEKLEDLHPADVAEMMEDLSAAERQGIIASLDEETAAAVLAELDERLTTQIVEKMDPGKAADILEEMAPDAAADVLADWMRDQELNLDQLDTIVLLDDNAQYSGTVSVARLLLAAPDQRMAGLKMEPLLSLPGNADDKEVFELFDKYNLRMLTVIDAENRPIGAITVDDVVSRLVKD
jgi:sporulation protein YlmC with PRC-barrel domain